MMSFTQDTWSSPSQSEWTLEQPLHPKRLGRSVEQTLNHSRGTRSMCVRTKSPDETVTVRNESTKGRIGHKDLVCKVKQEWSYE